MRKQIMYVAISACLAITAVGGYTAYAGDIYPPEGPVEPTMKTLTEVEPRTPIWNLPFTINSSGSYYLASSLTGIAGANGITITADNVTLDLNGFALIGAPGSGSGIVFGAGVRNPAVRNGTIRDWGSYGIGPEDNLNRPTGGLYEDLRVSGNATQGITVGPDSRVLDCNSSNNGDDGFNVGPGSIVKNCTARDNTVNGFIAAESCVFVNCTAVDNGPSSFADGFDVQSGGVLIGCAAQGNAGHGIRSTYPETSSVIVTSCTAISNVGFGINAANSLIRGCLVANNGAGGCNAPDSTLVHNHGSASCNE